ncbi:hypothetical protein AB205_0035040 [Aquarana catesbeiana]|uniref:NIDO domain-containing protein n=1 Tax=Aquarana catesbeiana TaxID=8400 RepID=A0A2G9NRH1_AQUCT|nr:hypothetical protein AB205_0035040 [Aquarana catesbeiana]
MPGPFTTRSTTITSPFTRNTTNTSPFIQSSDLLYPYGSALDIINPKADDGGSPQIFPSRDIPLFGRNYSYLYVNNNGLLSFASSISQFTPQALPVSFGNPFLAIFWADVYNELAGDIYYRESTDPSLLSRATSDIRTYFHAMNFTAQWVFVATWHRVAYFGSSTNKVNTFQAVLSTDGNQTFLLYNYGDIQWPSMNLDGFSLDGPLALVNNNGLLSFASPISQFTPQALPVAFGNPFLAIFWADVNNALAGDIYYRESTDPSLLSRATSDIRTYFHAANFTAQWVFVATWHRVAYFGSSTNKVNTFQAVVSTDGNQTFLLYNYADIQWPSMNWTAFSRDGPLALAGLNSGYETGYYTLPGSIAISVANLSSTSNVNVTGRWAFKVDKLHPEDANGNIDLLYPYGSAIDNINPKELDGGSPKIFSSRQIPLFGRNCSYLYVNNHGLLSFSSPINQYIPQALPVAFGNPFLAIFWTDVDDRVAGDIYYRESTNSSLLSRATTDIRTYFHGVNFTAQWVFVATWHRVVYYGSSTNQVNTFQAVLTTDGNQTFLMYNYDDIQWPSIYSNGYYQHGPLALAGLNSGYNTGYYTLPGSLTLSIANLSSTSNVNVTGRWAFKVDQLHPEDVNGNIDLLYPYGSAIDNENPKMDDGGSSIIYSDREITLFGRNCSYFYVNTFQAVLTTDGNQTFLLYNYADIQWPSTQGNGSYYDGPLALAGLNSGYNTGYYTLPGSLTPSIANLSSTSNVNMTGRWAFKVDQPHPEDVNGSIDNSTENENSTDTPLTTTPGPFTTRSTTITSPFTRTTNDTPPFIRSSDLLYPYGSTIDTVNPKIDDGGSPVIYSSRQIPLFGTAYSYLYVNNNGLLSFSTPVSQYRPQSLPVAFGNPFLAIFWADVDNRLAGDIYYRESTDPALLSRATADVRTYFQAVNFSAQWVFVATWHRVAYLGSSTNKVNTFQGVLSTDGNRTFLLYNYEYIQWPSIHGNGSYQDGPLALAGLNSGYDTGYYTLPGSLSLGIANLANTSNVNFTGRWAFRVDQLHPEDANGNIDDSNETATNWTTATPNNTAVPPTTSLGTN